MYRAVAQLPRSIEALIPSADFLLGSDASGLSSTRSRQSRGLPRAFPCGLEVDLVAAGTILRPCRLRQ
eukprot:CAMPEP_0197891366 /NCGR_PEP_ID=MMETSP1439-20131203/28296_1 /TAXON_ID=66791 /ORGANISM="Gonyaulax spinifera, Strain CCMP409" /LENGTH=67 /DNA_ID=CAMNT_0043511469 /DNA_START=122 /DNA_END=322 /DNA_ORIENTATION=+